MRTIAFGYGIILFLFTCVAARANDGDTATVEAAKQHFQQGMQYFDAKEYTRAVEEFRAAYDIKPTWKLRYNIAQAEAAAKRYGLALEEFEAYLGTGGDEVLIEREKDVLREIDRLRMLVGVLDVKAPDGTEIYIDDILRGTLPLSGVLRVAVGDHQVWMRHNGKILYDGNIKIAGAVRTRLDVSDASDGTPTISTYTNDASTVDSAAVSAPQNSTRESDKPQRFAFIRNMTPKEKGLFFGGIASGVVGVAALAGGVGFTVAAIKAADERDSYETKYSQTDDPSLEEQYANSAQNKHDEVLRDTKMMVAGYVTGGVFAAAGATLLILCFHNTKKKNVAVMPTINGIGITF
ncbi:MAG: hypothetical protein JXX14_18255 [Deltaproteobacteria bacterium]|nr:hypothetical protein [Deltaproteobacteria bacterium]